jgi:hypothetical protein
MAIASNGRHPAERRDRPAQLRRRFAAFALGWQQFWQGYWQSPTSC